MSSAKQGQCVKKRSDRTEGTSEERGQRSDGANPERRPPENSHPTDAMEVPRGAEPSEQRETSRGHSEHEHCAHEELGKGNLGGWILKDQRIVQGVELGLVGGLERNVARLSCAEEQHPRGNDCKAVSVKAPAQTFAGSAGGRLNGTAVAGSCAALSTNSANSSSLPREPASGVAVGLPLVKQIARV